MHRTKGKVAVGMSGGIDSSVAAYMLKEQGWDVIGLFMRTGARRKESATEGMDVPGGPDASRVAERLHIPLHVLDFSKEFEQLSTYLCGEYLRARTPNPCVICNRDIKFGRLLQKAVELGADFLATGHYARIEKDHRCRLLRGVDRNKDQSYFLFFLRQEQLARAMMPNGSITKDEARRIAAEADLPVTGKGESQELCFLPDDDYRRLLRERYPDRIRPGKIVDTSGRVVGEHQGVQFLTIGQRQGTGVALGRPVYVVGLDPAENLVVIGDKEELLHKRFLVELANWVSMPPPSAPLRAEVQIRYAHEPAPAEVIPGEEGSVRVEFDEPQSAITPGQAAVFYGGEVLLGGGIIEQVSQPGE